MWVHAKKPVLLGPESTGTTETLLLSKQMSLNMDNWAGRGMSGNGDALAFA